MSNDHPAPPLPPGFRRLPARHASPEKRARWAALGRSSAGGTLGAEIDPTRNFYGLAASAQAQGQNLTQGDFLKYFDVVRFAVGGWNTSLPEAALDDLAHIIVAWIWENVGHLSALDLASIQPFATSAFAWFQAYGLGMARGVPSAIRWDLVPWRADWTSMNLLAFDWPVVQHALASVAFLSPTLPHKGGSGLMWAGMAWGGSIPGTGIPWSAVPWLNIPWASVNWTLVRAIGPAKWVDLFGKNPSTSVYNGKLEVLRGKSLTPTARLLALAAELFPGSLDPAKIDPQAGASKAPLTLYLPNIDPTIAQEQAPPPPLVDWKPAVKRPPGKLQLPGTQPPKPGDDGPPPGVDTAPPAPPPPVDEGLPGVVKLGLFLGVLYVAKELLLTPPRSRRRR